MLAIEEDIGTALSKACELDSHNEAIHLAREEKSVRRHLFEKIKLFDGFPVGCQKESVPSILLALVNILLEGPSIHDNNEASTSAALSIGMLYVIKPEVIILHRLFETVSFQRYDTTCSDN